MMRFRTSSHRFSKPVTEKGDTNASVDMDKKKRKGFRPMTFLMRHIQQSAIRFALFLVVLVLFFFGPHYYRRPSQLRTTALPTLQEIAQQYVIISIGTTKSRQGTLLQTLPSLLRQTVLPGRIQIQIDETEQDGYHTTDFQSGLNVILDKADTADAVNLSFHPGPAKWKTARKLLGVLHTLWDGEVPPSSNGENEPTIIERTMIVLADDDFIYHPQWLESLLVGQQALLQDHSIDPHHLAVGLRGWRVRPDLRYGAPRNQLSDGETDIPDGVWGSFPPSERYVVQGDRLYAPYQVGVLVGCGGMLLRPTMFDAQIFQAPTDLHFLLNDVWTSGNLARRRVERWIVPMLGDEPVGTHLGSHATVIDGQLLESGGVANRFEGNSKLLRHFRDVWEPDLYWAADTTPPPWRGFLPLRHFLSEHLLLGLYRIHWIRHLVGDFRLEDKDWKVK